MQLLYAVILGLVQGLTEFIPVSSSGHLILVGNFLGFSHSGLAFDIALDIGTLAALYLFFAKDLYAMAHDVLFGGPQRKLGLFIAAATVPAMVLGVILQPLAETVFRSSQLVAINLIWVGIVMLLVDRFVPQATSIAKIKLHQAVAIGFAQALALVPGVSRSGATITAGRALGLDRVSATRFSFLLSAPIITGATLKVLAGGEAAQGFASAPHLYVAGIVAAFVSGYLAIRFMLKFLSRHGLAPFAIYRIVVGVIIITIGLN